MNFQKTPVASYRLPVASCQKNRTLVLLDLRRKKLGTGCRQQLLCCGPLLGRVPQAAAFDEAVKIFGEIGGVIAGTLQRLRHQQHFKA